jgi:hypothetical protein
LAAYFTAMQSMQNTPRETNLVDPRERDEADLLSEALAPGGSGLFEIFRVFSGVSGFPVLPGLETCNYGRKKSTIRSPIDRNTSRLS